MNVKIFFYNVNIKFICTKNMIVQIQVKMETIKNMYWDNELKGYHKIFINFCDVFFMH